MCQSGHSVKHERYTGSYFLNPVRLRRKKYVRPALHRTSTVTAMARVTQIIHLQAPAVISIAHIIERALHDAPCHQQKRRKSSASHCTCRHCQALQWLHGLPSRTLLLWQLYGFESTDRSELSISDTCLYTSLWRVRCKTQQGTCNITHRVH